MTFEVKSTICLSPAPEHFQQEDSSHTHNPLSKSPDNPFSTMAYMITLPSDILGHVLFPFLEVKDISRLDVAVTNHAMRPQLLEIYPLLSLSHLEKGINRQQIEWFWKRSITLTRMIFIQDISSNDIAAIFSHMRTRPTLAHQVEHVRYPKNITASHFSQMLQSCTGLKSLDLSGCSRVTESLLTMLATKCPQLQAIDLSETSVRVQAMVFLSEKCRALSTVSLRGCSMQDKAVVALAKNCPSLSSLDLSACYPEQEAVLALAAHCPGIFSISLGGYHLTDACVTALADKLHRLTSLDLTYSDNISDLSVIAVTRSCPSLTRLNLSYCEQLTDAAVVAAAMHCPGLTSLALTSCNRLTDKAINAVAVHCMALAELDVRWCRNITDRSMAALAENCPSSLLSLEVGGCSQISREKANHLFSTASCTHEFQINSRLF